MGLSRVVAQVRAACGAGGRLANAVGLCANTTAMTKSGAWDLRPDMPPPRFPRRAGSTCPCRRGRVPLAQSVAGAAAQVASAITPLQERGTPPSEATFATTTRRDSPTPGFSEKAADRNRAKQATRAIRLEPPKPLFAPQPPGNMLNRGGGGPQKPTQFPNLKFGPRIQRRAPSSSQISVDISCHVRQSNPQCFISPKQ